MIEPFGNLQDGRRVEAVTLGTPGGLQAQILTYGGILRRLTWPVRGVAADLVLSLPDLDAYVRDPAFLGILVGRFANRIAGARFELDGQTYRITANEGPNQLHGGQLGFGKRLWKVLDLQPPRRLVLGYTSPDGEEGYPGTLAVSAEFIVESDWLSLRFQARCDRATPLNLTWHPYFDLPGDPVLRIPASHFLPVRDAQLIPTGELASVAGTPFDFREPRSVRSPDPASHPQLTIPAGYDHCWVLDEKRDCDAELRAPGVSLKVLSERRALQFYGGQALPRQHPGMRGICLEPQDFPNAPNEPRFPPAILRPGTACTTTFYYRLSD
jgi:aldose 1-epimerase